VAELADVNSLFARSLLPWFAAPAHIGAIAAAGTTGTAGLSVAGGAAGARLLGRRVVSKIRANPAVSGAVVVASAAVAAALAVSMIGGESTVDEPGAPAPAAASAVPTDPADAAPPDPPPATVPPPAPRPHAAQPALAPDRPAPTAAPPPPDTRATEPAVVPTPPAAPESSPPPEAPPQPGPQPAPPLGPVVWLAGDSQVRITLTNDSAERTGFLVVSLEAEGGAVVGRRPAGCALGLAVRTAGLCGLPPLRPGETAVVHVPVQVTGPGQTARATVCAATAPRLDCDTVFLAPTTVALD
jgi:hypothetical protein